MKETLTGYDGNGYSIGDRVEHYHAAESYTAMRALCGVALPTLPAWTARDTAEVARAGRQCCARCLKSA